MKNLLSFRQSLGTITFRLALGLVWAVSSGSRPAFAETAQRPHVQVDLVSESEVVVPNHPLVVGARFALEEGWHLYWRNPGDSGEAPSIEWNLPDGFRAGDIQWPVPLRHSSGPLTNFVYEGTPLLPVSVSVPPALPGVESVNLAARVRWLVCSAEECIPGNASLSLDLPVGVATIPSDLAPAFAASKSRLPVPLPPDWAVSATAASDSITLDVAGLSLSEVPKASFFPYRRDAIEVSATQVSTIAGGQLSLTLPRWRESTAAPARLEGVLALGPRGYAVAVPISAPGMSVEPLVLAFLGGLLLNLMPCVLPVLALKALGLFGLANEERRRVRRLGLIYMLGVLVSFWALAAALLIVRAGGAQLGWGFQLQSPAFVALLAILFFWMALVLLGVTSVGHTIMGFGNRLTVGESYRSTFFTGVLATVVATPCTAPFMGTAIGYALSQSAPIALAVFTSLGLGLALPYTAITFMPALANYLPRPGVWMETLKQALAFPLLATVVWLVWVASLQAGPTAVAAILSLLVLISLATWAAGQPTKRWSRSIVAAAFLGVVYTGRSLTSYEAAGADLSWEPYSSVRVGELLAQGRPVLVDFTAAWCVTCQLNERLALGSKTVVDKIREVGVVPLRADWTRPDPAITRALQQFGRDGVPLYVLYSGAHDDPPRVLPQLLTVENVISELEQLATRRKT